MMEGTLQDVKFPPILYSDALVTQIPHKIFFNLLGMSWKETLISPISALSPVIESKI